MSNVDTRHRHPLLRDPWWVTDKYVTHGMTVREIADLAGCAVSTVHYAMEQHGIAGRSKMKLSVDADLLRRLLVETGQVRLTAAILGVHPRTVVRYTRAMLGKAPLDVIREGAA